MWNASQSCPSEGWKNGRPGTFVPHWMRVVKLLHFDVEAEHWLREYPGLWESSEAEKQEWNSGSSKGAF